MRKSCRKWFPTQVGLLFCLGTRFGLDFGVFGVSGGSFWRPLWTQGRPRAPQEAPNDPPRAPQRPPRASQEALEDPPGTLLGRLGTPGPDLGVILTLRGSILHRFWIDFGVDFRFELACDLPLDSGFELGSHGHGGARRAAIG